MAIETDKRGGYRMKFDTQLNTGCYPYVFGSRVPLWDICINCHFTDLGVERMKGRDLIVDTTVDSPIRGMIQTQRSGEETVYFGNLTDLFYHNGTDGLTNATRATGGAYNLVRNTSGLTEASHWSMVEYGSFILAANGVDQIQVDKATGTFEDITGADILTAKILQVFGPHVLAFNTDCSDREFVWSDADNIDDWVASETNLAGQLEIRELRSEIKAVVPLGSRLAVYGTDQVALVSYLANDLVFGYKMAMDGIGAVSPQSVVAVGRRNFGMGQQGFFVTDGASFEYIDDPMVRYFFRNFVDKDQIAKVNAYHSEDDTQVRWYFRRKQAITPELDYGLSYNYEKNAWSFVGQVYSAAYPRTTYANPTTGTEDGKVLRESLEATTNEDGDPIQPNLVTKAMDMGDPNRTKTIDQVRLGLRGSNIQYRLGWGEGEEGPINWEDWSPILSATDGAIEVHHRVSGRWLWMQIFRDATENPNGIPNADWELMSIEFIGRVEGTR